MWGNLHYELPSIPIIVFTYALKVKEIVNHDNLASKHLNGNDCIPDCVRYNPPFSHIFKRKVLIFINLGKKLRMLASQEAMHGQNECSRGEDVEMDVW